MIRTEHLLEILKNILQKHFGYLPSILKGSRKELIDSTLRLIADLRLNRFDPFIAGVSDEDLLNAIVFSLPASKIQATFVDGEKIFDQRDTAALESSARDLQRLREKLTF